MTSPDLVQSSLLVIEGRDELEFLKAFCQHSSISAPDLLDIGGKTKLIASLGALTLDSGFGNVRRLGIIRDADDNAGAAFQSVDRALQKSGLPRPKQPGHFVNGDFRDQQIMVGVLILPDGSSPGMLETLCAETVAQDSRMSLVADFLDRGIAKLAGEVNGGDEAREVRMAKARTQAYLSLMPKVDCRVGIAASRGYWNLDNKALASLASFVKTVVGT